MLQSSSSEKKVKTSSSLFLVFSQGKPSVRTDRILKDTLLGYASPI